jgi:heterodisulfide reductase subunit B
MLMDRVLKAAGAEVIDWPHKTECCGAGYGITDVSIVKQLSRELLGMAKAAGADAIATACPLCQLNLDLRQDAIERENSEHYDLPVFYFTQLLGLALGIPRKSLGLKSMIVSPKELLDSRGIGL